MRQRIINFLLKKLLNAVVLDDIIRVDKGKLLLGDKEIPDMELRPLIAEAKALEGFRLWQIINETVKNNAIDRGWNKSVKMEDLNTAKTIFYALDLQNSIIKLIKSKDNKTGVV